MDDATYRSVRISIVLAVALCTGCSSLRSPSTTAASNLNIIQQETDPNKRYKAYAKLATPSIYDSEVDRKKAVEMMIDELAKAREPLATRAQICRTLGKLGDPLARESIISATNDSDPIVRMEACRALGRVGKSEDATILARIMVVDQDPDCRVAAVDGLGKLKSTDPRIHGVLVNGLEHEEPAIRYASYQALKEMTGRDLGVDPKNWSKFLEPKEGPTADPAMIPAGLKK